MSVDGSQDALAGKWGDIFRPAESSGNRGNAEIQLLGEIVESHGEERYEEPGTVGLTSVLHEL